MQCGLKQRVWAQGWQGHGPHPTNDLKVSLTTRFRHVLLMVLDGVRILGFWGRRGDFHPRGWSARSEALSCLSLSGEGAGRRNLRAVRLKAV